MESIRLNNIATSMISCGKQEAALDCLQTALKILRGFILDSRERNGHSLSSCQNHSGCLRAVAGTDMMPSLDITAGQCGGKFTSSSPLVEKTFEFYDKAFFVSASDGCCCPAQVEKLQNMLLAVITYNLGNANHRMGICNGESRHFDNAMNFYEFSFSTIENLLYDFDFDSNLVLLLCGLYNNMGHINARANHLEETKFCLKWLQRTVNTDDFNTCTSMCNEDYTFFSHYLVYTDTDKQFRSAPSA